MSDIKIFNSWLPKLKCEFEQPYMTELKKFLKNEFQNQKIIYPKTEEYFQSLNLTPFEKVKVVIVGQDPYHGPGQAHGLSFSVQRGVRFPPSLKNIFKELNSDLGISEPPSGNLSKWAEQGVLLLNSVLTVESGQAGSHQNRGWEKFTDKIIEILNNEKTGLAFVFMGKVRSKERHFYQPKKAFCFGVCSSIPIIGPSRVLWHSPFFKN